MPIGLLRDAAESSAGAVGATGPGGKYPPICADSRQSEAPRRAQQRFASIPVISTTDSLFLAGKAAFYEMGSWILSEMQSTPPSFSPSAYRNKVRPRT